MKKRIIIPLLLLFFMIPIHVKASIFCTFETKAYLKSLASNINMSYDYVISNDKAIFSITFTNVYKDFILVDKTNNKTYYPDTTKDLSEIKIEGYESGKTYTFQIYTTVTDCDDEILITLYANLPYYNSFYDLDVCSGLDSYDLCSRWYNHGLTKEKFIETVEKYKESLKEEKKDDDNSDDSKLPYILEFYLKYYYIILPIIILGGGYVIYQHNKKDSFF